jgi:hypothetical protein
MYITINKDPIKTERAFHETSSPIMSLKERGVAVLLAAELKPSSPPQKWKSLTLWLRWYK